MSSEQSPGRGFKILAEIQSRRSERFPYTCDRWEPVDLGKKKRDRERELNRLKKLEEERIEGMYHHIANAMGWTLEETRVFFRGEENQEPQATT